jgi:hypothetical protein
MIEKRVKQKHWDPNWRNELTLEREDDEEYEDTIVRPDHLCDYYSYLYYQPIYFVVLPTTPPCDMR